MMAIVGYTHTQAAVAPPTDPYSPNNNVVLSPFSAFWGGAITDNIGAFAQVTYNACRPGALAIRSATPGPGTIPTFAMPAPPSIGRSTSSTASPPTTIRPSRMCGTPRRRGPSPTPFRTSWPTRPSGTVIEGAFAAHVGGVGAYTFINDLLYLELTGYRTLGFSQQNALGTDPFGAPGLFGGIAPYWRVALEPHWGRNTLMVGAFGEQFNVHPWIDPSFATWSTAMFPQTDKFTDIGFDTQYQYQGDNYWLTLRGSYIREFQRARCELSQRLSAWVQSDQPAQQPASCRRRLPTAPTTGSCSPGNISITGAPPTRSCTDRSRRPGSPDARTATAGWPRSPTSRSAPARRPAGRGSTPASACNTPITTSSTAPRSAPSDNNTLFLHAWFAM